MYLGTTSGDVFEINAESKLFKAAGPKNRKKNLFGKGIISMIATRETCPGNIVIGAGDGTVRQNFKFLSQNNVPNVGDRWQ